MYFVSIFILSQQELLLLKVVGSHSKPGPKKLPAEKDNGSGNTKTDRWKAGKKKNVQAKINTGLRRGGIKSSDRDDEKGQGKENLPEKQPVTVRFGAVDFQYGCGINDLFTL